MSALRVGSYVSVPELDGRWSVWSMSGEAPGCYFVVPADDDARLHGVKYAVIRAINKNNEVKTWIELIRTDPHKPELLTTKEKKR